MKTVGVPLKERVVAQLDAMVADGSGSGRFPSRAHVVRAAIQMFLAAQSAASQRKRPLALDPTID